MKTIELTKGKVALVDDEDYGWLSQYNWSASKGNSGLWYARRGGSVNKRKYQVYMHRQIMGCEEKDKIDHVDGNGLNNQRSNLRPATHKQNVSSQKKQTRPTSSRYKGVRWRPAERKWAAAIKHNGKTIYLGLFILEASAAVAYNAAALTLFGEFARLNKIQGAQTP